MWPKNSLNYVIWRLGLNPKREEKVGVFLILAGRGRLCFPIVEKSPPGEETKYRGDREGSEVRRPHW